MPDTLSPSERSERMSRVRSKDTKPELKVRRFIHRLGFRYRLHARDLPGSPDIVFGKKKKTIFIHGCFWHRHSGCVLARLPKSRLEFWIPKLEGNRKRDLRNQSKLRAQGWSVMIIWECQTKNIETLSGRIKKFIS